MPNLSISNESKNDLSVTNEERSSDSLTFDTGGGTFADHKPPNPFAHPRIVLSNESKNDLSITDETK